MNVPHRFLRLMILFIYVALLSGSIMLARDGGSLIPLVALVVVGVVAVTLFEWESW